MVEVDASQIDFGKFNSVSINLGLTDNKNPMKWYKLNIEAEDQGTRAAGVDTET